MHFLDKFANGTVKRHFFNGTIATYHNGILIRYEARSQYFNGDEDFIDFPTE